MLLFLTNIYYAGYIFIGDLANLPDLVISISSDSSLTLTPDLYTKAVNGSHLILFEKADFDLLSNEVVYIALGWDLMSRLYTVFERLDGSSTISVYRAASITTSVSSGKKAYWWIAIILTVIAILAGSIFVLNKWYKNKKKRAAVGKSKQQVEQNVEQKVASAVKEV